jgi:PAS domain S-box-containing protein
MSNQDQKLFRALLDVGKELAAITDLDRLLPRILEIARDVFRFDNAIIRLLSADGQYLETVASFGYNESVAAKPLQLGQGIMGKAAKFGRPYLISNLTKSDDYIPGIEAACSELAVPLIAREKIIGVFNVESTKPRAFNSNDCDALSILGGQAAIAIDNAHLYTDLCRVSRERNNLDHLNKQILSNINLGLYTVDKDLRITSWNHSMATISEIPATEAIGKPLVELFPNLEEEGVAVRLANVLEKGQAQNLRLLHRGSSGESRLQKRRMSPLIENGKTIGAIVVVEDITEFEQLLAQTIQSEKLAEVGRMSAGIAHEINNPLAVIGYACQLLQEESDSYSEDQHELLQRISTEVDRLQNLTSELLAYSGNQDDKRKLVNLNDTLEETLSLLRYEVNKTHTEISAELEGTLPAIFIDKNRFKQIFINLILNAIQAMGHHGSIVITTNWSKSSGIRIDFRDNGPGIPDEHKEKIFEPFFTARKDGTGTGLGLYLCRKFINEYQGELAVSNNPEGGCCFSIALPPSCLDL